MDRLRTFCRLCIYSSDWWAKEKECNDSEGKRERSSEKLGDDGWELNGMPGGFASSVVIDVDLDRPMEELLEGAAEGAREDGCCRIRRNPDRPRPWSWSVTMEDL